MILRKTQSLVSIFCLMSLFSFGQQQINLADQLKKSKIEELNREIDLYEGHSGAVEMNAANGSGIGILENIQFKTGIIEVELKGENNPGKSFIGMAFNIQDKETYEGIYFRPFNFVAEEQIRKDHMVQYIFHPEFTWRKLREERTGEFENEISNPPDPDNWFKAKIIITETKVEVYVNDKSEAVLSVERLTSSQSQKIGLWVGHGSSGRFRNLVITAKN